MLENLQISRIRFKLRVTEPVRLASFAAFTLRGAFGAVFREIVCAQPHSDSCAQCFLGGTCSYSHVFATGNPPGSTFFRKNDDMPRPFLFDLEEERCYYAAGDTMGIRLTLVGRSIDSFPYFFVSLCELGERGFGLKDESGKRGCYEIDEVWEEIGSPRLLYRDGRQQLDGDINSIKLGSLIATSLNGGAVKVNLLTPLRIKYEGQICLQPEFHHLVRNILRRVSALYYLSTGILLEMNYKEMIDQASMVEALATNYRWREYTRYSGRQQRSMYLGGVTGWAWYDGVEVKKFIPLLKAAEVLAVGKGATFGFGRISVESDA